VLYAILYVAAEQAVLHTSLRNRFFGVRTAPLSTYDVVLLGSSHATAFGFEDLNGRLEGMLSGRVLNLSMSSAGILPNRVMLDYFLRQHSTRMVVYFVDSFIFTSARWNEGRLDDQRLYARAPIDLDLARLLMSRPTTRGSAVQYVAGLAKINGLASFTADVTEDEAMRFRRVYSPSEQIDALRLRNLYPDPPDDALADQYLTSLVEVADLLRARGIDFVLIKPPVTERWYRMLPDEARWDARLQDLAARHRTPLYDFSQSVQDESLYFDADHLNRAGVMRFFEQHLVPLLRAALAVD
jgi:hypothetical protein